MRIIKGDSRTLTYYSWCNMKRRCYELKNHKYESYGKRGITVCNRWLISFNNFLEDMGEKPLNLTLDRINNDGNYEPSNCKWSTAREQALNRRVYGKSKYRGLYWCKRHKRWHARVNTVPKRVHLGYFNDEIEAAKAYDAYVIKNNLPNKLNFT